MRRIQYHRYGGPTEAGAFAEYLVVDEDKALPKPSALSFELAAALPMAGVTAWSAVHDRAGLRAGQSIFIAGCLGGMGRAAVQLALMRGAEVAGNCSAPARAEALELGIREVADYRTFAPATFRGRFDVVLDTAVSLTVRQCGSMLKPGGSPCTSTRDTSSPPWSCRDTGWRPAFRRRRTWRASPRRLNRAGWSEDRPYGPALEGHPGPHRARDSGHTQGQVGDHARVLTPSRSS
jgi:NADPH:quinone reductase-like Zn-dependent oxidoreductase